MKNYFVTAGLRRRVPTEIARVTIPNGMVVIARRNTNNPEFTTPNELKYDHVPMFRFSHKHISITNRCW